jgi:hypothetical protein
LDEDGHQIPWKSVRELKKDDMHVDEKRLHESVKRTSEVYSV